MLRITKNDTAGTKHENTAPTEPLYVSKPMLPDIGRLSEYVTRIWASGHVTNHGPFSLELESRLQAFLEVPTVMAFNNGTIGLMTALKLFDLPHGSEVITTPMTFAATAHSIAWNGLIPVFADVREEDLTIDPVCVARAITPRTSAILAVHTYGCICDYQSLEALASEHGLRLIFDAAHAFGTRVNGRSVATLGDASVYSFHATKLYNTLEGGAIATSHASDRELIYLLRNFGIKSEEEVVSIGLNGKINEIQAAIGLLNLEIFEEERAARAHLRMDYRRLLDGLPGVRLQEVGLNVEQSEQYLLVRIDPARFGRHRDEIKAQLAEKNIFARRYFYPLCTSFTPYKGFPIVSVSATAYAETAKDEVLCLPFHSGVGKAHLDSIARVFHA